MSWFLYGRKRLAAVHLFTCCGVWTSIAGVDADAKTPSTHTQQICRRYYTVTALKRIVKSLGTLDMHKNTKLVEALVTDADNAFVFEHPRIVDCWQQMQTTQSLKPFMRLWKEIKTYRFLDDQQLAREFAIFATCLGRAVPLKRSRVLPPTYNPELLKATTATEVGTTSVAFRFYQLHRLEAALKTVKDNKIIDTALLASKFEDHGDTTTFENRLSFRHPRIRSCTHDIVDTQSAAPIYRLCQEFRSFYFVGDTQFITELLTLIFLFQRYLLCQKNQKGTRSMLSQCDLVEQWYKKIDRIGIQEQIDVVDSMSALINSEPVVQKKQSVSLMTIVKNAVLVKYVIDLLVLASRYVT